MDNVDLIKKFCEKLNTAYLDRLEPAYAVLFQRIALHTVQTGKGRQDVAQKVLKYYNLTAEGKRTDLKERPRKKVESQVASMSVALTGARVGDILTGASKGSKGAVMRVHEVAVPPQARTLNGVRYYPDLWDKFLLKLTSIPFFADMSTVEREVWLDINEAHNENSIGQEGSRLELIQPGSSDFATKVSEADLDLLIQGNPDSEDGYWDYEEIQNMIPRKPGSKAFRHTLILIRSFWKLAIDYEVTDTFKGLVVDVKKGEVLQNEKAASGQEIFVLGSITKTMKKTAGRWVRPTGKAGVQDVGFLVPKERVKFSQVDRIINSIMQGDIEPVRHAMREFTPAAHKSLLQKIIRFSPEKVDIGRNTLVDPRFVLLVSMATLASMPGSFVPDIQRYVSGMESFTKRVAVSIYEDSSLPKGTNNTMFSMLVGSLLSQRARTWLPTESMLKEWLHLGIAGYEQDMAVVTDYNYEATQEPFVLKYGQNVLKDASAILDELRSFPTDLGLARGWAKAYPDYDMEILEERPPVMPIYHCVDQHWAPGVVHYFRPEFVYAVSEGAHPGKPFAKLFNTIWDESSGVNPRRLHIDYDTYSDRPTVQEIRSAQRLFLVAKQNKQKPRPETDEIFELQYELEDAWIAGLVGAIEVKPRGHPTMLVTLSSDDPTQLIAIQRPSRNMKEEPPSEEAEQAAIEIAKHRLKIGVPLNKAHAPDPILHDAKVYLRQEEDGEEYFTIRQAGEREEIRWDDIKYLQIALPVHPPYHPWNIENALTKVGTGVEEDAEERLKELVDETDNDVVRRALVYISTFSHTIEMNRVSRDGAGTYHAVLLEDVPAYQFLLRLSTLYPAAISPALYKPSTFTVPIGPVLWTIRKQISKQITGTISDDDVAGWEKVKLKDTKRKLWLHQKETLVDMIRNQEAGGRGSFLWLPVGSGKCLHPDTPVLLWDGDTKRARDIVEGDLLIGDDSTPREVLSTCRGVDRMYKIRQNKGGDYIVNEPHILTLKFSGHKSWFWQEKYNRYKVVWFDTDIYEVCQRIFTASKRSFNVFKSKEEAYESCSTFSEEMCGKIYWTPSRNQYMCYYTDADGVRHTKSYKVSREPVPGYPDKGAAYQAMREFMEKIPDNDLIDISVRKYLELPLTVRKQLKGIKVKVNFPPQDLRIPPYILGCWLGDGHSNGRGFTNVDGPCIEEFRRHMANIGCIISLQKDSQKDYRIRAAVRQKVSNPWMAQLSSYNLLNNKRIPAEYMVNSRANRLEVLAGLVDTDGHLADGCYEIVQKNRVLAQNICYLVRSLGFGCSFRPVKKTCTNGKNGPVTGLYYRCIFSGEGIHEIPCRLPRKRAHPRVQAKDALCTSILVESLGDGEYCGFELDGNGRFLLGDFTVTHNTAIVLSYLKYLKEVGKLPPYVVYTLPQSAIKSIIAEIKKFGIPVNLIIPLKDISKKASKYRTEGIKVSQDCDPHPFSINLIEHDHLRNCEEVLTRYAPMSIFIVDEVHKALSDTKRTSVALEIAHLSKDFIALTGTPVIDSKTYKLIGWLEQIVPYEVNNKNFWVAANSMIARKFKTNIKVNSEEIVAPFNQSEEARYRQLVPPALGGVNTNPSFADWQAATDVSYESATREMVNVTKEILNEGRGVMLVAKDSKHQQVLHNLLLKKGVVAAEDVFLITGDESINLTDEAVEEGKVHDYKVVIVPIRKAEGYTLTRLSAMVTSVYPSNNATREQIAGRINRLSQKAEEILYRTVHVGVLTAILQNHNDAKNLSLALQGLAQEIQ